MNDIISEFTTNLKTELDDKIKEIKNSSESINNEYKKLLNDNFNKLSEIQNSVEQNLGKDVPNKIVELSKNLNIELYNMNKTLIYENNKFINEVKTQFENIAKSFTSNEENIKKISNGITELSGKITGYNTAIDSWTQKYNSNISTIEGGINKIIEFLKSSKEFYTLEEGTLDKVKVFNQEFGEFTQEVKKFNTQFANAVNNISGILSGLQGEEVKETISTIGKVNKELKNFLKSISNIEELLKDQKPNEILEQQKKYLENIEKLNNAILSTLSFISSKIDTGDDINNFSNGKENG
jgi:methyl-accepting chemotaxis protein